MTQCQLGDLEKQKAPKYNPSMMGMLKLQRAFGNPCCSPLILLKGA